MTSYRHRLPDAVIVTRVALAFPALALLSGPLPHALAGLLLTVAVIAMDALDGWLARRLGVADELGAVLDIAGDRIVEHVYWIYFAVAGVVPVWVPLVIVTRSFTVDTLRGLALAEGRTPFGEKTMMRSGLTRFLVASRAMRSAYGVAKVVAFVLLGLVMVARRADEAGLSLSTASLDVATGAALAVTLVVVGLNLVRGLPVVWDSRGLLQNHRTTG